MGIDLCNCNYSENAKILPNNIKENYAQSTIETNLSKFERYVPENTEASFTKKLTKNEMRTKAGTLWESLTGLEKIITVYHVNVIIRYYREHLRRMKNINLKTRYNG